MLSLERHERWGTHVLMECLDSENFGYTNRPGVEYSYSANGGNRALKICEDWLQR